MYFSGEEREHAKYDKKSKQLESIEEKDKIIYLMRFVLSCGNPEYLVEILQVLYGRKQTQAKQETQRKLVKIIEQYFPYCENLEPLEQEY